MKNQNEYYQQCQRLLTLTNLGTAEELFKFLQNFHRHPFTNLNEVLNYIGVIDDQIDIIDCPGTKYFLTPLIIATGKGSFEKTKILLVHGADPNKQCSTGDTALNLAIHRQKYQIIDLLLHYNANPNLSNRSGKTALHRAVLSFNNAHVYQIETLLNAGADPTIEDRNQRIPLDEAVIANRPEFIGILLFHKPTLVERAYRAAILASHLGHDKCLQVLLDYGMNPNISNKANITPLHVAARSSKFSTIQLLLEKGADENFQDYQGETALSLIESSRTEKQKKFLQLKSTSSDFLTYKIENTIPNIYPLLRNHSNWILDHDQFRSSTARNSSVQNLLQISNNSYWCSTKSKNAWIIFDLKHEYYITGLRIIGRPNHSTPKNGHLDISNAFHGPWLSVKDFTCLSLDGENNDFFFPSYQTRFLRVFILDNYGGENIQIQGIAFFGVDMNLVNLLKEYRLEKSLTTLLINGINDQETLDECRDKILNSSDKYLHINDHFQFMHLTESLTTPQLTFLDWFIPPQTTIMAGEKLQTFSVVGNEGITDRVQIEEQLENNNDIRIALMKDLEPIQNCSLVDFTDYIIKHPGRYKIRVASVQSPFIHTPWQELVVGKKPREITIRTTKDSKLYTQGIIPPKLYSPSTTDITDELTEKELLDKRHIHQNTLTSNMDNITDDSDDNNKKQSRSRLTNNKSTPRQGKSIGIQCEASTRNIATMCRPDENLTNGNLTTPKRPTPLPIHHNDNINGKDPVDGRSKIPSTKPEHPTGQRNGKTSTITIETDTSQDGMKSPKENKIQTDPKSVKDDGTDTDEHYIILRPTYRRNINQGNSHGRTPPISEPKYRDSLYISPSSNRIIPLDKDPCKNSTSKIRLINGHDSDKKYIKELPANHLIQSPTDDIERYNSHIKDTPKKSTTDDQTHQSPILNIDKQNYVRRINFYEHPTPLQTNHIDRSNQVYTQDEDDNVISALKQDDLKARNKKMVLLSVLNSSRTYVFERQALTGNSPRQSRNNENFYLGSSLRSLNSCQQDDTDKYYRRRSLNILDE